MTEAQDRNRLYVEYWFEPGASIPISLLDAATLKFETPKGTVLAFEDWVSEESSWAGRQAEFDLVLARVLSRIQACAVDGSMLKAAGGTLDVRLVCLPVNGIAGLCITADVMSDWAALGADWYLESWSE